MDAFISYRRQTGGIYALEIYHFLKNQCKLDVFFDRDGLYQYAGEFPSVLEENIKNADNFILIMTDLDIENYEKSVFIQEIVLALKQNKRIIVVKGNAFEYPENLPAAIECLPDMQTLDVNDALYFKGAFFTDLLAKMLPSEKRDRAYALMVSNSKLESRNAVESRLSLTDRLNTDVIAVDICATACQGLLTRAREHLERVLQNGCRVRIVMNHPDCPAAVDAYSKKIAGGGLRQRSRIIARSYTDLLDWQADYPGLFEGRTTEEFLPCAIFIIRTKDPAKDTVKVDYYAFEVPDTERRCVLIPYGDRDNFDFYVKQFEWIWNNAVSAEHSEC